MDLLLQNPYGLIALVSLPVVLGIYWFRRRHRIEKISGLFLWDEPVRSLQGGTQMHRPPPSRSLLLDLLCALLVSLAIASPAILKQYDVATVFVFDDSLSMRANANDERAKEISRKLVTDKGAVIFAGENPQVVVSGVTAAAQVEGAINKYNPYRGRSELQKAIDLARELQPGLLRIHIFTDSEALPSAPAQTELVVHTFAGRGHNPAILKASRSVDSSRQLLNLSIGGLTGPVTELQIADGSTVFHSEKLQQTGDIVHLSLEIPRKSGEITVRLDSSSDSIKADSVATLLPPPVRMPGFTIDLPDEKMAKAVQRALFACGAHEGGDLLVTGKDTDRGGSFTLYVPPAKEKQPTYTGPYIIDLANILCRDLSLDGVYWTVAQPAVLEQIPATLVMAGNIPLYWLEAENRAVLNINFAMGNVERVPAWPVLFANLCERTSQLLPGLAQTNYLCAQPLEYIPAEGEVIAPECYFENSISKERRLINGSLRNALTPAEPGVFNVLNGKKAIGKISINPLFPAESDTTLLAGEDSEEVIVPKIGGSIKREPYKLNRILIALAIAVFLLNGYLNKRSESRMV